MTDSEAHALYEAAWQAHCNGCNDEALRILERAIAMATCDKVKSVYLATKGGFLNRNQQHTQAVDACTEAVALEPNNFHAFIELGIALMRLHRYKAAAEALQSAAALRCDYSVLTVLAKVQLLSSNPSAARASAEKALELNPSWDEAQAMLDAARNAEARDNIE